MAKYFCTEGTTLGDFATKLTLNPEVLHEGDLAFLRTALEKAGCTIAAAAPSAEQAKQVYGDGSGDAERRRRTSMAERASAAGVQLGAGCYLYSTEENGGTVYLQWSKVPINDALAYLNCRKATPGFKFTTKGGKSELKRGLRGPLIKNYYQAWCEFVRLGVQQEADIVLLPAATDVQIVGQCDDQPALTKFAVHNWVDLRAVSSVVAVHLDNTTFSGSAMDSNMFKSKGLAEGYSIATRNH